MLSFTLPLAAFSLLLQSPADATTKEPPASFEQTIVGERIIVGAEQISSGLYGLETDDGSILRVKAPDASIVADLLDGDAFSQTYRCKVQKIDQNTYHLLECGEGDERNSP